MRDEEDAEEAVRGREAEVAYITIIIITIIITPHSR